MPDSKSESASAFPSFANLTARRVKMGKTTFHIGKLLPMEGFDTLERIRLALGKSADLSRVGNGSIAEMGAAAVKAILSLPPEDVARIRDDLFAQVRVSVPQSSATLELLGNEGMAFEDLEPVAVYELLARCIAVNFSASFSAILSGIQSSGLPMDKIGLSTETSPDS